MFIIKGVNIYPMQIEQVIMTFAEVGQSYLILLENDGLGDVMRVQIEIRDRAFCRRHARAAKPAKSHCLAPA